MDLALVDELWNISEEVVDDGVLPAMWARPQPLLFATSTAGTEASTLMRSYRERGLRQLSPDAEPDNDFLFLEYSPDPGADRDDSATWVAANPALGRTIDLDVIRGEHRNPNTAAFDRASLNRWVSGLDTWVQAGVWGAAESECEPEGPPSYVAVESGPDFTGFGAVAAWPDSARPDRAVVRSFATSDLFTLFDHIEQWQEQGVSMLLCPPVHDRHPWGEDAEGVHLIGDKELRLPMPWVTSLVEEAGVLHNGDLELAEHIGRVVATTNRQTGDRTLNSWKSPGPVFLARALVWAVGYATRPPEVQQAPVIHIAR